MKKTKLGQALIKGMKEIVASEKKPKQVKLKSWLIPKLRRLSYTWPPRNEAKKLARVARGQYKCAKCMNIFGPKEVAVDHISPVVIPEEGWKDFDKYVTSLFCDVDNFQIVCHECHDQKTREENERRK